MTAPLQIDTPTVPGWYEYRWAYGTPGMKSGWVLVEVVWRNGVLLVKDRSADKRSLAPLNQYAGAEWCRRG